VAVSVSVSVPVSVAVSVSVSVPASVPVSVPVPVPVYMLIPILPGDRCTCGDGTAGWTGSDARLAVTGPNVTAGKAGAPTQLATMHDQSEPPEQIIGDGAAPITISDPEGPGTVGGLEGHPSPTSVSEGCSDAPPPCPAAANLISIPSSAIRSVPCIHAVGLSIRIRGFVLLCPLL